MHTPFTTTLKARLSVAAAAVVMVTSQAWAQAPTAPASAPAANDAPYGAPQAAPAQRPDHQRGQQPRAEHHGKRMHPMPGLMPFMMAGPHAERHTERLLKRIKATDEQRQAIHQAMRTAREQQRPLMAEGRTLHQDAMALWAQPDITPEAVDQLRMRMNAHHQRMTEANSALFLAVARVLTPEQRVQIAKSFQERRDERRDERREQRR